MKNIKVINQSDQAAHHLSVFYCSRIQTPTAGQKWRYPSSPSLEQDTPSLPWRRLVTSISPRRMKTWMQTRLPSAGLCLCSEVETMRACSTLTWRPWPWRTCWLLFRELEMTEIFHPPTTELFLCIFPFLVFFFLADLTLSLLLLWFLNNLRSSIKNCVKEM